jgi:hypothetical protein
VLLAAAALASAVILLAGCSGAGAPQAGGSSVAAPSLPTPLATSIQTPGGIWATVPMGHLDQPLNSFWQLFLRPVGSSSWSDRVQATGAATNGGLILASQGTSTIVGVRPSNLLKFSPLISTSDGGRSWSTGLLADNGLAARPNALAAGPKDQKLALIGSAGGGAGVLGSSGNLSSWRTITTTHALASTPAGRACGLSAITAVAYLGAQALLGGGCSRAGEAGIFAEGATGWQLLRGVLPSSLERARVEVLELQRTSTGVRALLALADRNGSSLLAAWNEHGHWSDSPPLPLTSAEQLSSFGPAASDGIFVLIKTSSGADRLAVASGPGGGWRNLPTPPAGTSTVAFGPGSSVDALSVRESVLTVWSLTAQRWTRGQVIDVPIEYGSSE